MQGNQERFPFLSQVNLTVLVAFSIRILFAYCFAVAEAVAVDPLLEAFLEAIFHAEDLETAVTDAAVHVEDFPLT